MKQMKRCMAVLLAVLLLAGCNATGAGAQEEVEAVMEELSSTGDAPQEDAAEPNGEEEPKPAAGPEDGRNRITQKREDYVIDSPFPKEGEWYLLSTAGDLRLLREIVDEQAIFSDGTRAKEGKYRLTRSVDLSDELHPELGWIPIGSHISGEQRTSRQWTSFSGEFDGGMHPITGLVINAPDLREPQGLFGHASNATIRNVVIEDCSIRARGTAGGVVGRILASNSSSVALVEHCMVTGTLQGSSATGGAAGTADIVRNCGFIGTVSGVSDPVNDSTSYAVGGVAGNSVRVEGCFARGTVTGFRYVGGVTGNGRRIFDSYFIGSVEGAETVGGVIGSGAVVQSCYSAARVSGFEGVGGIVGHIATTFNVEPETIQAVMANLLAAGAEVRKTEQPEEMEHTFDWPLGRVAGFVGAGTGGDNLYGLETMDTGTTGRGISYLWDGDHFPHRYLADPTAWQDVLTPQGGWDSVWKQQEGCYPQLAWEQMEAAPLDLG